MRYSDTGQGGSYSYTETPIYTASPGETNTLTIRETPEVAVVFTDLGATIEPSQGCRRIDDHSVICEADLGVAEPEVDLGDEDDTVVIETPSTVFGGSGDETLVGTEKRDVLDGGPGTDVVSGGRGNDSVGGGTGTDTVSAGPGNDIVSDAGGRGDRLAGGEGNDRLDLASRRNGVRVDLVEDLSGEPGERDAIPGIEDARGGRGADVLIGDRFANILSSPAGNDLLVGAGGSDLLGCETQIDRRCRIEGGAGDDSIDGGAGPDVLLGGSGNDEVSGYGGRDLLAGGPGADLLRARDGNRDRLEGGPGRDRARADARLDVVRAIERLY